MTLLSIQRLQIPYSKKGLLPSFSFELNIPAQVFVVGANGIGKSTFLKQLSGKLENNQAIFINQKNVCHYPLKERAHLLGFLEQQHPIHFPLIVKDLVVMGKYASKTSLESYSATDYDLVYAIMEELGISYLYDKNFLTLSGGEQQLCLLAQIAIQDPDIILLDEPTQSLDLYNKGRVFKWMEKQVVEKNKTVVCVTHDLHWLTDMKGYLLFLNQTKIELLPLSKPLVLETIESLTKPIQ
ncbi:MAG: iron transporter ATPase [Chitinophagaceae bacterium]|nr:iron transporter ATPase [Chitinophagaceae bacterium]